MDKMKITRIDNRLGLLGVNLPFLREPLFDLQPGIKVVQIGDGRETGCIRTDTFKEPVIYVGSIYCQFDKLEKMYAFGIPEKTYKGDNIYFLYGSTGLEMFTESTYSKKRGLSYLRFYKPIFKTK